MYWFVKHLTEFYGFYSSRGYTKVTVSNGIHIKSEYSFTGRSALMKLYVPSFRNDEKDKLSVEMIIRTFGVACLHNIVQWTSHTKCPKNCKRVVPQRCCEYAIPSHPKNAL